MTNIEQKALALAIEAREDDKMRLCPDPTLTFSNWEALCRAADRIEQLEREKAVVSDLWEQQKQIALDYLADCNKAADHIEAQAAEIERLRAEAEAHYDRGYYDGYTHLIEAIMQIGAEQERAKTVAWLRSDRIVVTMDGSAEDVIASAIEVGEHLKEYGK
jgi:hypothetical protein